MVADSRGAGAEGRAASGGPGDPAGNVIALNRASATYAANAAVVRTLGDIAGGTVDLPA